MCCGEAVGDECAIPSGKASPNREMLTWWSSSPQGALLILLGLELPVATSLSPTSTLTLCLTCSKGSTSPSEGRAMQLW